MPFALDSPIFIGLICRHDRTTGFRFPARLCYFSKSDASPSADWHQPSKIFQSDQKSNDFPIGRLALLSRITFVSTNNSTYPLVSPFGRLAQHYQNISSSLSSTVGCFHFRDLTFHEIAHLFSVFVQIFSHKQMPTSYLTSN